jgi:glutamyl/glutaminyl-tRNA synthetase
MPHFTKTRIAPTPSGFLHEGNAFAFIITAALAKIHGATILLRVDDLDNDRKRPEYVDDLFQTLHWLGVDWKEGPTDANDLEQRWSQIYRIPLYEAALERLREKGLIYACGCSRKDLSELKSPGDTDHSCRLGTIPLDTIDVAWRLRIPKEISMEMKTLEGKEEILRPADMLPDPVVRRRDGIPAYQIASVCDDHFYGIDLIVRGEDLRASTAVQLFMAEQLGYTGFCNATFHHHPLMTDAFGAKWSKSAGAEAVSLLGKTKEASAALYGRLASLQGLGNGVTDLSSFTAQLVEKLG